VRRDASPGFNNWAMSLVCAHEGRGEIRCNDGLATDCGGGVQYSHDGDMVIDAVDHGHLRATILSFNLQLVLSQFPHWSRGIPSEG
jgi:hypothetical protein